MFPTIDKKRTGIRLRKMMDKCGVSVKEVQKYLGLGSVQSVYHWLNGISMPTVDNLYALSEFFRVPMDELVCGNRETRPASDTLEMVDRSQLRLMIYYDRLREKRAA